jgi:hypothetical protein
LTSVTKLVNLKLLQGPKEIKFGLPATSVLKSSSTFLTASISIIRERFLFQTEAAGHPKKLCSKVKSSRRQVTRMM